MDESQHPARKQFLALFYNPTRLAALPAVAIWIYIWAVFSSVWIKILCSLSAFLPFSFVGWGIHSAIKYGWTHPFTVFAISFVTWLFVIAPVLVGICSHLAQSRMKLPYMVLNGIFLVPLYGLVMNILSAVLIWRIWPVFDTPVGVFALFSVFVQFNWITAMQGSPNLNADETWFGAFSLPVSLCGYALPIVLWFVFTN